jgi:cytochrome P450
VSTRRNGLLLGADAAVQPDRVEWCMAKRKREVVDELLDALVWMRRKAKKHEAVDDLVDALIKMRRKAKKKLAVRKRKTKRRSA